MADFDPLEPADLERGMSIDAAVVGKAIGYGFTNAALLREALTHASAVAGSEQPTYQRLEFLGDRVLGLVVADMLYLEFPEADEGELSRRLTQLVRRETCAKVARAIGIGKHILLGDAEKRTGAERNRGILANVCESLIGAVYLDGGYPAAHAFIAAHWRELMVEPDRPLRDAKTTLQEWAHKAGYGAPVYRTMGRDGPDHAPVFVIEVSAQGLAPERGSGSSKRAAEQAAAQAVLQRFGVWDNGEDADGDTR